jgi:hypothetical protein
MGYSSKTYVKLLIVGKILTLTLRLEILRQLYILQPSGSTKI